ncbi:MAG TPA: ATP-binding cassette domain-containing protein [Syntrophomonadaceae bacterium]|nr:ATP-binding cassette domain-containing protein [Syntrophomonadaceae bacterium]
MIVLQSRKISKAFGEQDVLKGITFSIKKHERVGLIGGNGSGKTTFLRCLAGQLQPDQGEVMVSTDTTLGYLEQMPELELGISAWEAVMQSFAYLMEQRRSLRAMEEKMARVEGQELERLMAAYARVTEEYERAGGYECESTARHILIGMGFKEEEFDKELDHFSGGQKTRLNLARLLALSPDLLLLDEPTNHLDMVSVEWLEGFLQAYPGTVLVVSHDRMFLDHVATRVAEIRGGKLKSYEGNYSMYIQKRQADDLARQRAYDKQQEEIQATEEYIRRYGAGIKARQARGRMLQLNRLERLQAPGQNLSIRWDHLPLRRQSAQDVLTVDRVSKSYGSRQVLRDFTFTIKKGEKWALIGPNGCGKSTLLKIIAGEIQADAGQVRLGSRVDMAYFSQAHETLHMDGTVLDEIIYNFDLTIEQARTYLGSMLFCGDDVFKRVRDLSGGEQGRLAILKIILTGANFLILDEPTNHLDIDSRQVVEEMLAAYPGTILLVSHDRYLIDQVADQVLAFEGGQLKRYWGNYSYYARKVQEKLHQQEREEKEKQAAQRQPEQKYYSEQKEIQRMLRQRRVEIEALEDSIADLEYRQKELEDILSDPQIYADANASKEHQQEYHCLQIQLSRHLEKWESLGKELLALEDKLTQ